MSCRHSTCAGNVADLKLEPSGRTTSSCVRCVREYPHSTQGRDLVHCFFGQCYPSQGTYRVQRAPHISIVCPGSGWLEVPRAGYAVYICANCRGGWARQQAPRASSPADAATAAAAAAAMTDDDMCGYVSDDDFVVANDGEPGRGRDRPVPTRGGMSRSEWRAYQSALTSSREAAASSCVVPGSRADALAAIRRATRRRRELDERPSGAPRALAARA